MTSPFRLTLIFCPLLCVLPLAASEEPIPAAEATETVPKPHTLSGQVETAPLSELISSIRGLFDVELPRLDPPGTYKLIFNPHFGDLVRRGYIITDVGLRWALNDHFGIDTEFDTYATHGLRSKTYGYGIGQLRDGIKYVFKEWPKSEYQTSVGFDTVLTVDHPPIDMTDGLNHFTPNIAVQYRPPAHPRWTTFAGANIDFVKITKIIGTPAINTPRDDSLSFTGGAIYDLGQVKWTLQATYTTTAVIGDVTQNFYSVRPSVLWYAPKRFTFNSKTQWIFGAGLNATWGPDGFNLSNSTRVRAEITFRQVMKNIHDATQHQSGPPAP